MEQIDISPIDSHIADDFSKMAKQNPTKLEWNGGSYQSLIDKIEVSEDKMSKIEICWEIVTNSAFYKLIYIIFKLFVGIKMDWKTTVAGIVSGLAQLLKPLAPEWGWLFDGITGLALGFLGWLAKDKVTK